MDKFASSPFPMRILPYYSGKSGKFQVFCPFFGKDNEIFIGDNFVDRLWMKFRSPQRDKKKQSGISPKRERKKRRSAAIHRFVHDVEKIKQFSPQSVEKEGNI